MIHYVGIDPGLEGAIASISSNRTQVELFKMPVVKTPNSRRVNGYELGSLFSKIKESKQNLLIGLELVHSAPRQGVVSMFTMGQGLGIIQGVLEALNLSYQLITPQKWKKLLLKSKDKTASVDKALELYPHLQSALITPRGRKDHNLADALLIAHYIATVDTIENATKTSLF